MKPPPFDYLAPASLDEALTLLGDLGDGAKVLAGGQSLVPLLNFRLVRPQHLVDLNGLAELAGIREHDVIVLPHERIHPLDISAPNVDKSEVTVMRVGGKLAIDATKPPLWRKKEREEYTRVKPKGADDPALQDLLRRLASMA